MVRSMRMALSRCMPRSAILLPFPLVDSLDHYDALIHIGSIVELDALVVNASFMLLGALAVTDSLSAMGALAAIRDSIVRLGALI